MLRENEISGWVNPSHLSSFVIQDKRTLLFYFFGKMLNGSSEEVWATLCMPEVSLNRLPCIGSMRIDLQKRPQKSWCEYESKEPLEVHIYSDWMVFSISVKYFVSWRCYRAFFNHIPTVLQFATRCKRPLVICGARRQSREGQWQRWLWKASTDNTKHTRITL